MNTSNFGARSLELPDTYEWVRLGYVARLQNGLTVDAKRDITGDVVTRPYLRVANVQAGSLNLDSVTEITVPRTVARRSTLRRGDVLMTEGGDLDKLGRGTVWQGELEGCLHQNHVFAVRPDPQRLSGRFLAYLTQSLYGRHYFESTGTRTTNLASTNSSKIQNLPLPLPSLVDQRRIADFLDAETARIDELTSRQSNQSQLLADRDVSDLSEVYQNLMQEYGAIRLRHMLARIEQGWSPQCEDRQVSGQEWGVIKAGCVNGGVFDPAQHKALPDQVSPRQEYALKEGDLLMSRASGSTELIGSVGVVPEIEHNLLLCDKVYRLSLDLRLGRTDFVSHMLRSHMVREHMKTGISGGEGMANNLPTAVVKDCVLPKAPLSVQGSTARKLNGDFSRTARVRDALRRSIKLLAERRQALITAAVTGQFDVSTASGRNVTEGVAV
ncbi:restriction endonuclease subunit S [Streptomyces tirandamycinicus]|uniref:restriction endonuclease subunit S n=1 Tax=Streptomyces tirandamycinicus TaxID=2174846 RepID=UPI0034415375